MSTTPQNILHLARQGDPDAIAALMNRHLETQGITARVAKQESTLCVNLEAAQIPNQAELVAYVKKGVTGLELAAIDHLTVSCQQLGADTQAWSEDLTLQPSFAVDSLGELESALDNTPDGADLDLDLGDLGFADQPVKADAVTDLDVDLGVTDSALDIDPDGLGDLDFDLGFTDGPGVTDATSDLDFDLGFTDGPGVTDATSDLDFYLDFTDGPGTADAASDLDFDLGFTDGPGVTDATSDLDFDLGFTDGPGVTDATSDLDFDLDFTDAPGTADAASDLDFDLGFTDAPGVTDATSDLDFDLDFTDAPGLTDAASDLDFDLGFTDEPGAADAASDLDFDLGFTDESAEAVSLGDLDFGLDLPAAADTAAGDLDFDLGLGDEVPAVDLGDAEADDDLGLGDLGLDIGFDDVAPDTSAELDTGDLGLSSTEDTTLGLAIGLADGDLDLGPEVTDTGEVAPALDDPWGQAEGSPASPALGLATNLPPTDDVTDWGDFPPLEDLDEFDEGLVAAFDDGIGDSIPGLDADAPGVELGVVPGVDPDDADVALDPGLDGLPELVTPDDGAFEDLRAAADFDLAEPAYGFSEWAAAELALATGDDLGDDALLGSAGEDLPSDLANEPLGIGDLGADEAPEAADLSLGWSDDAALTDPTALDLDNDLDPDLGTGMGSEFDPSLTFNPPEEFTPEEFTYGATVPNPFESTGLSEDGADYAVDALGMDALDLEGADPRMDLPFDSTMELDQTVGGAFWPPNDPAADAPPAPGGLDFGDDFALDQPGMFAAEPDPALGLGFDEGAEAEDLLFESVELGAAELAARGLGSQELSDDDIPSLVFGDEGLETVGFDVEGFDAEGFDIDDFGSGSFSDSAGDANGFQIRNGAALLDDGPDATDDFIHEFGSDPSTHVSLTPNQLDKDGGVRRTGGSGFPLRLVLGLGLGVLVLALAGLVLKGVLDRLRPPAPGGAPVVTEPAPGTAAPPAEADLFRAAVNAAQSASNQAQTATTAAQWQAVADAWAQSIDLMKQVPQSDPNYAVAQQKAKDYQPNLAYAQQNVQKLK
jgi:hypothetical protein